jgi:hypothetical protein
MSITTEEMLQPWQLTDEDVRQLEKVLANPDGPGHLKSTPRPVPYRAEVPWTRDGLPEGSDAPRPE